MQRDSILFFLLNVRKKSFHLRSKTKTQKMFKEDLVIFIYFKAK